MAVCLLPVCANKPNTLRFKWATPATPPIRLQPSPALRVYLMQEAKTQLLRQQVETGTAGDGAGAGTTTTAKSNGKWQTAWCAFQMPGST